MLFERRFEKEEWKIHFFFFFLFSFFDAIFLLSLFFEVLFILINRLRRENISSMILIPAIRLTTFQIEWENGPF